MLFVSMIMGFDSMDAELAVQSVENIVKVETTYDDYDFYEADLEPWPYPNDEYYGTGLILQVAGIPDGEIQYSLHAEAHGAYAHKIRDCVERNGHRNIFESLDDPNKMYLLCPLDDLSEDEGIFGIMALLRRGENWIEMTSFKCGKLAKTLRYLERFSRLP